MAPSRKSRLFVGHRRSDHAGEALHDIHAHKPVAAGPISGDAITLFRDPVIHRQRSPARRSNGAKRR